MSEYFTMDIQTTTDPDIVELITNQTLTDQDEEVYPTPQAGEVGSPIAQAIFFAVDGIQALTLVEDTLIVTRQPGFSWEAIIDEIRDVLRDFFL
ncbi:MAG: hypothetical protein D6711_09880 [Chloroflexi bacterium]|nr:MAG: hypothetical protein D6711_09880 [Chloroflexota bacterium]